MKHLFFSELIWRAFNALAALITYHVALISQLFPVECLQQKAHPVALQPKAEVELITRQSFEVICAVEIGSAVDAGCAGAFKIAEVRFLADVFGAFEHHVFKQMRETCASCLFVRRTDVIPRIKRNERKPVVLI